jgi:hypothetical protein
MCAILGFFVGIYYWMTAMQKLVCTVLQQMHTSVRVCTVVQNISGNHHAQNSPCSHLNLHCILEVMALQAGVKPRKDRKFSRCEIERTG